MRASAFAFFGAFFLLPLGAASAQLAAVGPISADNGFPLWYRDGQARQLDLCLSNTALCLLDAPVTLTNPGAAFPANYGGTFPDEAFWWAAEAEMPTNNNGEALLVLAVEAAFANDVVAAGDQVSFARIRIRVDNLLRGRTYNVTTPFGEFSFVAQNVGQRGINFTRDIGLAPGNFSGALNGGIGPFLRWDSGLPILDAQGREYIGDPNILHTVTGSPTGQNLFRIQGPSVGGPGVNSISTNLFSVMGQVSRPAEGAPVASFTANPTTGVAPLSVAFTDTSTGTITARSWNFGDGGTSTVQNPTHVYATTGTFIASLTVTGPGGSNTASTSISVTASPAPVLGEPTPGQANENNTFRVTGTSNNGLVFLLGSLNLGSSNFNQSPCGSILTGLQNPTVLANTRASGTTATFRVSINGNLAGRLFHTQAVDLGRCVVSNINSHVY